MTFFCQDTVDALVSSQATTRPQRAMEASHPPFFLLNVQQKSSMLIYSLWFDQINFFVADALSIRPQIGFSSFLATGEKLKAHTFIKTTVSISNTVLIQ